MLETQLDHLVITAPSLELGDRYVHQRLGINTQPGGNHEKMGTHNRLLKLGPKLYLEVIAKNPDCQSLQRSSWFDLDLCKTVNLATWVVRTQEIKKLSELSPIPLGKIEDMQRNNLQWQIAVHSDGGLPMDGICPSVIQWHDRNHPAMRLSDYGCYLERLVGFHSEVEKLKRILNTFNFSGNFDIVELTPNQKPYLIAYIQTPNGLRQLGSPAND